MAVGRRLGRTSDAELEYAKEHPTPAFVYQYAREVLDDPVRTQAWLEAPLGLLGNVTPQSLLNSGSDDNLRRVLAVLIQLDYGVFA